MGKFSDFNLLYWVYRIGHGVKISDINRNSKRARSVVRALEDLGLVVVESYGRVKVVKLTSRGLRVYERVLAALGELRSRRPARESASPQLLTPQRVSIQEPEVPEWLIGNPWLRVIGERGRA